MSKMVLNITQSQAPIAIQERKDFDASALSGRNVNGLGPFDSGRLSGADEIAFRADMRDIVYVVRSYSTPIAWVTNNGDKYKVSQRFSNTTSTKHMPRLYLL